MADENEELEYPHWLDGSLEYDGGFSFCFDCATEIKGINDDILIDGGWLTESDTPEQCFKCLKMLACTIIECGTVIDTVGVLKDWESDNPEN